MAYQVLARKWRPKKFQDVIGQSHITKSLQNAILRDKLGHAYIMTGTRGIGKTSIARIFAKALRCENRLEDANPCGTCDSCLDFETTSSMNVLEIDGASNNSVDDVRELISNVQYLPSSGKYKIYIIDEVHMLSTSAFNALLKTLEEPPAHALFIFATTEPEKLLGTVLSRCQRFDFRNATVKDLTEHLKMISKVENITFENDELIKQICSQGKGSVRDTLSLLDQVLSFSEDNKVTEEVLVVALGLAKTSVIKSMTSSVILGDVEKCSKLYRQLLSENISVKNIVTSLLDTLFKCVEGFRKKEELYAKEIIDNGVIDELSQAELFWIYESFAKDLNWTLDSISPEDVTEIALQKICLRREIFNKKINLSSDKKKDEEIKPTPHVEEQIIEPVEISSTTNSSVEINDTAPIDDIEPPMPTSPPLELQEQLDEENVDKVVVSDTPSFGDIAKGLDSVEVMTVIGEEEVVTNEDLAPIEGDKNWDGFLTYLSSVSPATSSNLEQGNIIAPLFYNEDSVTVNLGFSESSKVFLEYLQDQEINQKVVLHLGKFFGVPEDKVNLELTYISAEEKIESNFLSRAEIKDKAEDIIVEEKKEDFLNNPLILQAQDIFNTKVDKIVIGKDNK